MFWRLSSLCKTNQNLSLWCLKVKKSKPKHNQSQSTRISQINKGRGSSQLNNFLVLPLPFLYKGLPGLDGKESSCSAGDLGSVPGLGRSPGDGNGNHSSILAWNSMDRGAWCATVLAVTKSRTLTELLTHTQNRIRIHILVKHLLTPQSKTCLFIWNIYPYPPPLRLKTTPGIHRAVSSDTTKQSVTWQKWGGSKRFTEAET